MSPAPVVKYLQALLVSVSNNTCVGLAGVNPVAGDAPTLGHQAGPERWIPYSGRYHPTAVHHRTGLHLQKDSKTGGFILGIQGVLLLWTNGTLSVPVGFHLSRQGEAQQT